MMRASFLLYLLLIAGVAIPTTAQELFRRTIPLTEGNTPLRVTDLALDDARGYLWAATSKGLFRYTGSAAYRIPDSLSSAATAVIADARGVFAGFADGRVCSIRGEEVVTLWKSAAEVTALMQTPIGIVAATGGEGIVLLRGGAVFRLTTENGLSDDFVYTLALDTPRNGPVRLLAGTDRGITVISILANGSPRCEIISRANTRGLLDDIVRVIRPVGPAGGAYIIGAQAGGVSRLWWEREGWPTARWEAQYISAQEKPIAQVNDVLPLDIITAAEARTDGLFIPPHAPSAHGVRSAYRAPGPAIHRILQDRRGGGLWLGTATGLEHLSYASLNRIAAHRDYALSGITALAQQLDLFWYAQDRSLFSRDEAGSIRLSYTAPETITCLCPDWTGRLWIGTLGGGVLCREKNGRVHSISSVETLRGGHILAIGSKWDTLTVASLSGVEELEVVSNPSGVSARSIHHHGRASGAGSDYVYALLHDWPGRLWMATDGAGVVVWDGRSYRRFDSTAGFAPRVVYALAQSPANGDVWAGTLDGGLMHWNGDRWTAIRKEQGLPGNTVFAIQPLEDGTVVAVTDGGIAQWLPKTAEARYPGALTGGAADSFSTALNTIARARDGSAVLPVAGGFLHIEPSMYYGRAPVPDYRPWIALHSIKLLGEELAVRRHHFAPEENAIGFQWEGIHLAEARRLHYRYRLRGWGRDEWVRTADDAVDFPRLPPGNYSFEVQAALREDFEGAATARYGFRIALPLWKRWWFWTLVALGIAGAGYALLKRRDRARHRLATLQQARLRAEYEGLKSQVNPHFLFNSLNTLVNLIEEDPAAAAYYTEQLSDLYRETLSFRSRDVVTLAEEWDVLQKYLHIQQSRFGNALRVEAQFADDVLLKSRIIPLALQLLVENAIKHNEVSRANPLTISISATDDSVTVRNVLRPKASQEKGTGIGLENIRNRYALLTSRPVLSSKSGGYFTVTLPLL